MFSKACEYGIRATIYIAEKSLQNKKVGLIEVAEKIESPEAYTSKILQELVRNKIIRSDKGPTGGFSIPDIEKNTLTISQIVVAIDGDQIFNGCGLGLKQCNEAKPCPVHDQFKEIRNNLKVMLETTTVNSLAEQLHQGLTFLRR